MSAGELSGAQTVSDASRALIRFVVFFFVNVFQGTPVGSILRVIFHVCDARPGLP